MQHLFFLLQRKEAPRFPSNSSSCSVSELAQKTLQPKIDNEYPPCCHWFALALYNLYCDLTAGANNSGDICVNFLGKSYTIKRVQLNDCLERLQHATEVHEQKTETHIVGVRSDPLLCNAEITYTALLSRAIDHFLFTGDLRGATLHQFPTRIRKHSKSKVDRADILVASSPGLIPVLCSNIKRLDYIVAEKESVLYGVNCIDTQRGRRMWPLVLGMPGTPSKFSLQLYLPIPGQLWRTTIIKECDPKNEFFLCTMYVGIQYLLSFEYTVNEPPPICYQPKKGEMFECVRESKPWVVKQGDKCFKVCDTKGIGGYCGDVYRHVDLKHTIHYISNDKRFVMIERNFIVGKTRPLKASKIGIFTGALVCLRDLHTHGFVHGDVREDNIIFTDDGVSHLIDFELARKEGTRYPVCYVNTFEERHDHAQADAIMKKDHDVYAIKTFMSRCFRSKIDKIKECASIEQLIEIIKEE